MADPVPLVEAWRGERLESRHRGHAVIADAQGRIRVAWGDPAAIIYPRSSVKMVQALPLLESGAGAALDDARLALACASHRGAAMHVTRVAAWLADLGLSDADLRCGAQAPGDPVERGRLREGFEAPSQAHNVCSGKHAGFLMLAARLGGGPEYVETDHPVQRAVRTAFEEMCGEASPGFGIDGCSAPNFAASIAGIATAMARMADPSGLGAARDTAARRLVDAMRAHPLLIAGEGQACSVLTAASGGRAAVKFGAEGVHVAILPEAGLGVAIKIEDGASRASECAIAALLVRLGVADAADPAVARWLFRDIVNLRGLHVGRIAPNPAFWAGGAAL